MLKKLQIKSKKADIPVTILVLLTIILCIFVLISFHMSSKRKSAEITDYSFLEKIYMNSENQMFLGQKGEITFPAGDESEFEYKVFYVP